MRTPWSPCYAALPHDWITHGNRVMCRLGETRHLGQCTLDSYHINIRPPDPGAQRPDDRGDAGGLWWIGGGRVWLTLASHVLCTATLHSAQWEENTGKGTESRDSGGKVCVCFQLPNETRLSCGLTLAESPLVINALLAHIAHLSSLEAPLGEGVIPSFGKLQADRRVTVSS